MSTFADPEARNKIQDRLGRLTPTTPRRWGQMTSHQMVCHLNDAFRVVTGERIPKRVDNLVTRTLVRFIALHTPLRWPQGLKTVPEADQMVGGIVPKEWAGDCEILRRYVTSFGKTHPRPEVHPMFGSLNEREWMVWAYRHCDHHLRQFGL